MNLISFTKNLVLEGARQEAEGNLEKTINRQPMKISLVTKLVEDYPRLLHGLLEESLSCLGRVIVVAQAAHVSSDDGFAMPSTGFIREFNTLPVWKNITDQKDIASTELQAEALAYLRFYEVLFMTGTVQGGSLPGSSSKQLNYILLVLLGLANREIAHLSRRVLCLLMQSHPRIAVIGVEGGQDGDGLLINNQVRAGNDYFLH